jgi:dihydrofolate reductase
MEVILACTQKGGIGLNGKLPWKLKEDMKLFKTITTTTDMPDTTDKMNAVIMGRKTWESIPTKFRPLPNRINIILSTTLNKHMDINDTNNYTYIVNSIEQLDILIEGLKKIGRLAKTFIIGGGKIYNTMFELNRVSKIHLSWVNDDYECDTFFDLKHIDGVKFDVVEIKCFNEFRYIYYSSKKI